MENIFEIGKLFEQAFGYKSKAFEFAQKIPADAYATLGSPFYAKDSLGRDYFLPVKIGNYNLPYPVISIRSRKIIVDTPMVERGGSVKEFIGLEDYSISIRGIIVAKKNEFPEAEIKALHDLWKINTALPISNALTDIVLQGTSQKVVLTNFELPELGGTKHVKPYQIEMVSDQELKLVEQ